MFLKDPPPRDDVWLHFLSISQLHISLNLNLGLKHIHMYTLLNLHATRHIFRQAGIILIHTSDNAKSKMRGIWLNDKLSPSHVM